MTNMQQISYMMLGAAIWIIASVAWGYFTQDRPPKLETQPQPDEVSTAASIIGTDLSQGVVRDRLTRYLKTLGVTGDANIRHGIVIETLSPREIADISHSLRIRTHSLLGVQGRGQMQGKDLYYKRVTPTEDPRIEFSLADVSTDDLATLAILAERVAEDRRRSRSLYKGLSDDEMTTLARSAMAEVKPDHAAAIRAGEFDQSSAYRVATTAIGLLFSIKGAGE